MDNTQTNHIALKKLKHITPKQKEVLFYLAQGFQNKQIAFKMGLSPSTVKLHLAGLYLRLNVNTRIAAVLSAQKLGLLEKKSESSPWEG